MPSPKTKKKRVHIIHWKPEEAAPRVAAMEKAGYRVSISVFDPELFKALKADPPDAFVIDLGRLPSHGRDTGLAFREAKTTRLIPVLYVEGADDKIAMVKKALPDATYTTWRRIRGSLTQALKAPVEHPIVPHTRMDGYSGTPLPKKLGIKAGMTVATIGGPKDFLDSLSLPDNITRRKRLQGKIDLAIWFLDQANTLTTCWDKLDRVITPKGSVWIAWPKKASGIKTDITQSMVRQTGLDQEWVDFKIAAIDATWSGLKFTRRKKTS